MGDREMALLREIYGDWGRGDFSEGRYYQPDFELAYGSDEVDVGEFKGLDDVASGWGRWLRAWSVWTARPNDWFALAEDRILVTVHISGRAKETGREVQEHAAHLWDFRDGLAARLTVYAHARTALREFKLDSA